MRLKILFLTVLLYSIFFNVKILLSQNEEPEQIVLNYFVENIWHENYPKLNKIYFSGLTDSIVTNFYEGTCFIKDHCFTNRDTIIFINSKINPSLENNFDCKIVKSTPKRLLNSKLIVPNEIVSKWRIKKKGFIKVYNCAKIRSNYYVQISLEYYPGIYDSFSFEVNEKLEISHWCKD